MNRRERLREIWNDPRARAVRAFLRLVVRALARLVVMMIWELRLVWLRFSSRARIFLVIIGLVLISGVTSSSAASISAAALALAVLLLAFVGFWIIFTAPFRSRRWW